MTVQIEYEAEEKFLFDYEALLRRVIQGACDYVECPYEAEVNVVITDNEGIREVNRECRGIDAPTDVLSFPMLEYERAGDFEFLLEEPAEDFNPDTGELLLGDIMINYDRVVSQAESYGHSVERELAFLTAHSMFHLFGYDHMEEDERLLMEEKQEKLMQVLGIFR
jgi:probable rRNA maturation factor